MSDRKLSLNNLEAQAHWEFAWDLFGVGKIDEALVTIDLCLEALNRLGEPSLSERAQACDRVASLLSSLGRYQQALHFDELVLYIQRQIMPENNLNTAISINNLARSHSFLGNHDRCLELDEESLDIFRQFLDIEDPMLATSMNNLACSYRSLGRYEDALKFYEETLELRRRILPHDHLNIATSMDNLASCYSAMGRKVEALNLREETVAFARSFISADHTNFSSFITGLAISYFEYRRHEDALELHSEALSIRRRALTPDHPIISASINNISISYYALGHHKEALEFQEEALSIRRRVLPPDHPDIAASMKNLAFLYSTAGRCEEALALNQERIRVQITHYLNGTPFMLASQRTARLTVLSTDVVGLVPEIIALNAPSDRTQEQALLHLTLKGLDILATTLRPTLFAHAIGDFKVGLEQLFSWQAQAARLWNATDPAELDRLRQLTSQIETLEAQLTRDPQGFLLAETLGLQVLSLEGVCAAFSERETLISYDVFGETLVATVVRQDGHTAIHALEAHLPTLEDDVKRIKEQITSYSSVNPDDLGELYDMLLRPLEADLQFKGRTTSLVISGDAFLYTLPWGLLTRSQDGSETLLMELVQLRLIPTPRDLVRLNQRSKLEQQAMSASLLVGISRFGAVPADGQEPPIPSPSPAAVPSPLPPPDSAPEDDSFTPKRGPTTRRGVQIDQGAGGLTQDYLDLNHVEPEVRAVGQILQNLADQNRHSSPRLPSRLFSRLFRRLRSHPVLPSCVRLSPRLLLPPHPLTADVVFAAIDSPEILHLSTHSDVWNIEDARRWYAPLTETVRYNIDAATSDPEHPFSRAVVLFEGANRLLQEGSLSGILRAWEIATLKLRGTGLVVFSSCNSGLIESSAGYGLAGLAMAAFLAGAQRTLSTLWSVNDHASAVFIVEVYRRWLQGEANQTLQGALTETQRACMRGGTLLGLAGEEVTIPIDVWAAFVLNGLA